MTTLTLQEAIFTVSNLRTELANEYEKFSTEYRVPISVNNEKIDHADKFSKVNESLAKVKQLRNDLVTLKTAIHHKNSTATVVLDGTEITASSALESLKIERGIINNIKNNITFGYGRERVKTISGVGIVEEGIINEDEIKEYLSELETLVNKKSILIDKFNSTETIDVTLTSI